MNKQETIERIVKILEELDERLVRRVYLMLLGMGTEQPKGGGHGYKNDKAS